jgi:hypothetical protein
MSFGIPSCTTLDGGLPRPCDQDNQWTTQAITSDSSEVPRYVYALSRRFRDTGVVESLITTFYSEPLIDNQWCRITHNIGSHLLKLNAKPRRTSST